MLVLDFPENYKELFTPSKEEKKQKDVYIKLHEWVLRKIFPENDQLHKILFDPENVWDLVPKGYKFNVSSVGVCEEDCKKLKDLFIEWVRKAHRKSKKYAEKAHAWHNLDVGPRELRIESREENKKPGFIYVDLDNLWEKDWRQR